MSIDRQDETNSLALTTWGSSTLDALQASSDEQRDLVARRACDEAIADARDMAGLQVSLFEKLLVIERFGLYRARGHGSIQEFLEKDVAPVVQLHRGTLYRLKDAVWEAARLLQQYGSVKADWSHLSLLAGETRKQEKGQGTLAAEEYDVLSRRVAEGALTRRELEASLQKRPKRTAHPVAIRTGATAPVQAPPRCSPFDELARITADVRRPPARVAVDLGPTIERAEALLQDLERIGLQPSDAIALSAPLASRLQRLMLDLAEAASTTAEIARRAEAA